MQRIFLALIGFAAVTASYDANAQLGLSFQVKAIPQFSFLQNKDDNNNKNIGLKATFNAGFGVGAGFNFTNNLGVGLDVLYSLQGQRYKVNAVETNQKVNYFKLPLYFSFNSDPSKSVSFVGKLGPQLSILTGSKLTNKDGNDLISDTKDRYQSATLGGMLSAGTQFKVSKKLFVTTSARFDYDFINAEDDSYTDYPVGRAKTYNMTTGLEVGIKYQL